MRNRRLTSAGRPLLGQFQPAAADDFGPFRQTGPNDFHDRIRPVAARFEPDRRHAAFDLGRLDDIGRKATDLLDDRFRGSGRCEQALPVVDAKIRNAGFLDSWNVRQVRVARSRMSPQRLKAYRI